MAYISLRSIQIKGPMGTKLTGEYIRQIKGSTSDISTSHMRCCYVVHVIVLYVTTGCRYNPLTGAWKHKSDTEPSFCTNLHTPVHNLTQIVWGLRRINRWAANARYNHRTILRYIDVWINYSICFILWDASIDPINYSDGVLV